MEYNALKEAPRTSGLRQIAIASAKVCLSSRTSADDGKQPKKEGYHQGLFIEYRSFASLQTGLSFVIPHVIAPEIEIHEHLPVPTLKAESQQVLESHYRSLSSSFLRRKGNAVIFGTYDNLHIGHLIMLRSAKVICDHLYVGVEQRETALRRKHNKHPIMPDEERIKAIESLDLADGVFIRYDARRDIQVLEEKGVPISLLVVGGTQNDNEEIMRAVAYCHAEGIAVVAMTRTKPSNINREISSSFLHQAGLAKTGAGCSP